MKQYIDALKQIMQQGQDATDRTGVGCRSLFGMQIRYDLTQGFPAMTTKRLAWRAVVGELLWFIEGSGDLNRLSELTHGTTGQNTIWHANALAPNWLAHARYIGDAGRIYGVQWRRWQGARGEIVDQLANLIEGLKQDPHGRRHILTAWQPAEFHQMCLPPCHVLSQFYVRNGVISCQLYQRSADWFLGVPFNVASYSLFTHMIAQVCGFTVGEFIHTVGDAHVYHNHFEQVEEQIGREPLALAKLNLNTKIAQIDAFGPDDIALIDYQCHKAIKAHMAV